MAKACAWPAEAPTEGSEAAEEVNGMPERGRVSSRSPTEEIGLWRVLTTRGKKGQWPWGRPQLEWLCSRQEDVGMGIVDCW